MNTRRRNSKLAALLWRIGMVVAASCIVSWRPALGGPLAASSALSTSASNVCVDAEVNGERALSYDCLNRRLVPASAAQAESVPNAAEARAKAPSNQSGTFNWSAESIRFGSSWQKSATPQRPSPMPAMPPAAH
jgi:hypothetical protein